MPRKKTHPELLRRMLTEAVQTDSRARRRLARLQGWMERRQSEGWADLLRAIQTGREVDVETASVVLRQISGLDLQSVPEEFHGWVRMARRMLSGEYAIAPPAKIKDRAPVKKSEKLA